MTVAVLIALCAALLITWMSREAVLRRRIGAARLDPVTGLATRSRWTRQARRILRDGRGHFIAIIDLDEFKLVNDTHGHLAGDHVLATAASRIDAWAASVGGGACGRFGGDEFVVITRRAITDRQLVELGGRLAMPAGLTAGPGAAAVTTRGSIGAAACGGAAELSAAMAAADGAMYAAKKSGGGSRISPSGAPSELAPRRRPRRQRAGHAAGT